MPPKKTDTKSEGAAAPKAKATSNHPSYQDMIIDAITTLKDRNGSSRQKLKQYVKANNNLKPDLGDAMFDSLFNRALKAGVEKGVFEQPKGASGGTKLAKKSKDAAAPKKAPAAKKEAAPKKETAAKSESKEKKAPATKKAAPKKATATKKEPAAKKETATKKAAPKKAAAKKAAPKKEAPADAVVEKSTVLSKTKSGRVTKTTAAPKTAAKKAAPKKAAAKKEKTPKKAAAEASA